MEVPGSGVRKVVMVVAETPDGGESTESVVLQCTSSGDVEDGEEVERSEAVGGGERFELSAKMYSKMQASRELQESEGDCDEEVGVVVRARAWLTSFANDSAYWNTGGRVRTRRCKAPPKSYAADAGEAFVVDRMLVKRKHEEIKEGALVSESELDEGSESDDSASSSDSDASDSEYEQSNRTATSNKRRRGGEETMKSMPWADEPMQLKFGPRRRSVTGRPSLRAQGSISSEQETANCDYELKEMQLLLELQLKASERREAGMKQRMKTMMDLMSRHVVHVEKRVSTLEVGAQPQEQILERINVKLEKVMEGFTTLNENLSILSACLSRDLESQ